VKRNLAKWQAIDDLGAQVRQKRQELVTGSRFFAGTIVLHAFKEGQVSTLVPSWDKSDPSSHIQRLQLQVEELRLELETLRGGSLQKPPLDPIAHTTLLRQAHSAHRADPQGLNWPYTDDTIVNELRSLDEHRHLHKVTREIMENAEGLLPQDKILLSIAVRFTQSARGAAKNFRAAIENKTLAEEFRKPLTFPDGAPYRNVLSREEVSAQAEAAAREAAAAAPFPTIEAARDFLAVRLRAHAPKNSTSDQMHKSSFHSAEVAKDIALMQMITDTSKCPLETGALKGQRYVRLFYPSQDWDQMSFAQKIGTNACGAEILYCEYAKYVHAFNWGMHRVFAPQAQVSTQVGASASNSRKAHAELESKKPRKAARTMGPPVPEPPAKDHETGDDENVAWRAQFEAVTVWVKQHEKQLPKIGGDVMQHDLALWIKNQRAKRTAGQLNDVLARLLGTLDTCGRLNWDQRYAEVQRRLVSNPQYPSGRAEHPGEVTMASWIKRQRQAYAGQREDERMSEQRLQLLLELPGWKFPFPDVNWSTWFGHLKRWHGAHKALPEDRVHVQTVEGAWLPFGIWLTQQRNEPTGTVRQRSQLNELLKTATQEQMCKGSRR
jgi:hypothetical protein